MRYWAALIIPFFIMSCALEKETTDEVNGVFAFTTASVCKIMRHMLQK